MQSKRPKLNEPEALKIARDYSFNPSNPLTYNFLKQQMEDTYKETGGGCDIAKSYSNCLA